MAAEHTSRVEWTSPCTVTGDLCRYASHDMPARDAEAMAATMRAAGATDVRVLTRDA